MKSIAGVGSMKSQVGLCLLKSPYLVDTLILAATTKYDFSAIMSILLPLLLTPRSCTRSRAALQLEVLRCDTSST